MIAKKCILAFVVLAGGVAVSPMTNAGEQGAGAANAAKASAVSLDPFTLTPVGLEIAAQVAPVTLPPVKVPYRPPARSPFTPPPRGPF